jgi:hypothetical protein
MNTIETHIDALLELFEQKEISEQFDQKFCQTLTEIFNTEKASIFEYDPTENGIFLISQH